MVQQGQVFPLTSQGETRWAYRYRIAGRGSRRVQRGGFPTEQAAVEALERALERLRREGGLVETPTLAEFVDVYLRQHGGEPETIDKLRWLLAKSVRTFGDRRLSQLRSPEIAAWRMTIPNGHRFETTQALRQVLNRALEWGLIDFNPAKTSRQPAAASHREATLRIVGGGGSGRGQARRLRAVGDVRGCNRSAAWRVARARVARHRSRPTGRIRAPQLSKRSCQVPKDGGKHASSPAAGAGARRARRSA